MHPVRQNIAWHPEVNGDLAVMPAVCDPALQQDAVVYREIPEEAAESVIAHVIPSRRFRRPRRPASRSSTEWTVAGPPVAPGVPCTSLRVRPLPAPEIPGTMFEAKGTLRKYQDGPSSCAGTCSGCDAAQRSV